MRETGRGEGGGKKGQQKTYIMHSFRCTREGGVESCSRWCEELLHHVSIRYVVHGRKGGREADDDVSQVTRALGHGTHSSSSAVTSRFDTKKDGGGGGNDIFSIWEPPVDG